jgi:hypothetical protein
MPTRLKKRKPDSVLVNLPAVQANLSLSNLSGQASGKSPICRVISGHYKTKFDSSPQQQINYKA